MVRRFRGWLIGAALLLVAGLVVWLLFGRSSAPVSGRAVELALPAPVAIEHPVPMHDSLMPAPDPALVETTPGGLLPIVGKDGRLPWQVYARPFDRSDQHARVALLITGLGLDAEMTRQAIERLPGPTTLVFDPYAGNLNKQIAAAREAGHEVLVGLPMEPTDFPRVDPGPETLLTSLDDEENMARFNWVLSRGTGYVGVATIAGSRFSSSRQNLQPILLALKQRGLIFIDTKPSPQSVAGTLARSLDLAWGVTDRAIDAEPAADAIDAALAALVDTAHRNGVALGLGTVYPVTFDRVKAWAAGLHDQGISFAPCSAIVTLQRPPEAAAP